MSFLLTLKPHAIGWSYAPENKIHRGDNSIVDQEGDRAMIMTDMIMLETAQDRKADDHRRDDQTSKIKKFDLERGSETLIFPSSHLINSLDTS